MQPKVSVLMPVYNAQSYLHQCMDTVVGQTLKDIEIVCVNDGSTDDSLAILKAYAEKDSRIVIVDKANGGYGMAMNVALDKAAGEYVGIVEPDDFVLPEMFETLYRTAHDNDLDFVKSDFFRFSTDPETGEIHSSLFRLSNDSDRYNVVFNPSATPSALRFNLHTWTGIYRKAFLTENNIRHNETPGAAYQDNGFWFQTFLWGERAMIIDKPFYMYRVDNPNSSINNKNKVYTMNVEYDFIRKLLMRHPEKWELFREQYWHAKFSNYVSTLNRIAPEFRKEYVARMAGEFRFGYKKNEYTISSFCRADRLPLTLLLKAPSLYGAVESKRFRAAVQRLRSLGLVKKLTAGRRRG